MQLCILQVPLYPLNQLLHLRPRHTPKPHQQPQTQPLQPVTNVLTKPRRQPLHMPAARPTITRPHKVALLHIDQPRGAEHLGVPRRVARVAAGARRARHDGGRPALEVRALPAVVKAAYRDDEVLELKPAAGRERGGGRGDDGLRGVEAGREGASVDEVEGLREDPRVFGVVDFEAGRGSQWTGRGCEDGRSLWSARCLTCSLAGHYETWLVLLLGYADSEGRTSLVVLDSSLCLQREQKGFA